MVDDDAYSDYLGLDQNTLERIMRRPVQMAPRNPRFVRAPVLAAEYIRTSSETQRHSIVNQQRLIREFATANGMTVVRTYTDTPVSGLHAHNRKGFKALLADVMQHRAEYSVILVYDVSRWGRFQDVDQAAFLEFQCRQAGVQVMF